MVDNLYCVIEPRKHEKINGGREGKGEVLKAEL